MTPARRNSRAGVMFLWRPPSFESLRDHGRTGRMRHWRPGVGEPNAYRVEWPGMDRPLRRIDRAEEPGLRS